MPIDGDAGSAAPGPSDDDARRGAVRGLRAEDLTWTSTERGVTVLDLRTERYLQLNRSGALLWELLSDGASEDELVDALRARFGIDEERARADTTDFLAALAERGFLRD